MSSSIDHKASPALDFGALRGNLYGRSKQVALLTRAYHRHFDRQHNDKEIQKQFIVISGASGSGKTCLALSLKDLVSADRGYFISGKFDQLHSSEPYAPLVVAFTDLVNQMISRGDDFVASVKEKISAGVGGEGKLMTDMVPALVHIIGEQKEVSVMQGAEAIYRFHHVVRRFVRALCQLGPEPKVLFLDDLQWADQGSLNLISALVTDSESQGMLFISSCRDNAAPDSPPCITLRQLEADKVHITNVGVRNLQEEAVNEMLSDLFGLDSNVCQPLSKLVRAETDGNVLFIIELLRSFVSTGFLYFNSATNSWDWDTGTKSITMDGKNVVDLISSDICRFPEPSQEVLRVASCLGAKFEKRLLECSIKPFAETSLVFVCDKGLIVTDTKLGTYKFNHDRVQQAAYSLIVENQRDELHLKIGRRLWSSLSQDELDNHIFVVLSQLKRGAELLKDPNERYKVASLCLVAGEKSVKASAFQTASELLQFGIGLLGYKSWEEQYDLTLSLHNACAEAEFVTGDFEVMDNLTENVFRNARSFQDQIRAYAARIYSLGVRDRMQDAIDTGLMVLTRLKEPIPRQVRWTHVIAGLIKTQKLLKGKSDEQLMRLPIMIDQEKLAAMQILNLVFLSAYLAEPELAPLIAMKMVQITLHHGLCAISSLAFAAYGIVLCGGGSLVEEGYRYGELAMAILSKKFQAKEWFPRVAAAMYGCIAHWSVPIKQNVQPLLRAHQVGLETGDIEYSMLNANLHGFAEFACGTNIQILIAQVRRNCSLMEEYNAESALVMARPFLQLLLNLSGQSDDPLILTGESIIEAEYVRHNVEKGNSMSYHTLHQQKMILGYIFGDYQLAYKMGQVCSTADLYVVGSYGVTEIMFFMGLISLALARSKKKHKKELRYARRSLKMMRKWSSHAPENFLGQLLFLEAEYAVVKGQHDRARRDFFAASSIFGDQGQWMHHTLACERAAEFMKGQGRGTPAQNYLRQAYESCDKWGATAKTKLLKEKLSSYDK